MPSLETPEIEKVGSEAKSQIESNLDEKIRKLLDGPPSSNYVLRQIQLAVEKFSHDHPNDTLDRELMSDVMKSWENSNYSKDWRATVTSEEFKTHPRFKGDCAKVTIEDLEEFVKTKMMPE